MVLASTLPSGSISYLYFSDRINQLPLGVLGISISTALLPLLSKQLKEKKISQSKKTMNECLMLCFLISIPATFGIFLVSDHLLEILFVRGEFSLNDARLTGMSLRALCLGLPAFIFNQSTFSNFFQEKILKHLLKLVLLLYWQIYFLIYF